MERGIDAYKLKITALVFMILDHVKTYIFNCPVFPVHMPNWVSLITRFVSPLFVYLMIDGFYHTRSRKKYLIRLFTAAIIMWTGNTIINYIFHSVDPNTGQYTFRSLVLQGNNIFLSLALSFSVIWCLENIRQGKNKLLYGALAFITTCLCLSFYVEGGSSVLSVAVIIWFFYEKKNLQCIAIGVLCVVRLLLMLMVYALGSTGSTLYAYMCYNNGWAAALVIPLILLYNGERGKNTKFTKYLFYVIYPAHLWILMIVRYLIEQH